MKVANLYTSSTPNFVGAWAVYDWDPHFASEFEFESRFGEKVQLWKRKNDRLFVPRALVKSSVEDDRRIVGAKVNFKCSIKARNSEQERVIGEASELLNSGESFVLEASTGFGKTVCSIAALASVGRKTLIIVNKEDLMRQWSKSLQKFLGLKPDDIGIIRGDKYRVDKPVVLGMLHSLSIPGRYPKSLSSEFGLVVWDEVHHVPADTFQYTAGLFSSKLRLGLSATPYRADGKEVLFQSHIGTVDVQAKLIPVPPSVGMYMSPWKCPRVWNDTGTKKIRLPHSPVKAGHIIKMLVNHPARNDLIMRKTMAGYERGRKIVIFSKQINHLEHLQAMAHSRGASVHDTALYISGISEKAREEASLKPLIFATYGMMKEGTDIPWLDTCVLGTPLSDVVQPVGRVLREYEGKPKPVVIDIWDQDSPVFDRFAERRVDFYRSIKGTVKVW